MDELDELEFLEAMDLINHKNNLLNLLESNVNSIDKYKIQEEIEQIYSKLDILGY